MLFTVLARLVHGSLDVNLSSQQVNNFFSATAEDLCATRWLHIFGGNCPAMLSPDLFASAVCNVEYVVLGLISHEQMEALFTAIIDDDKQIEELDISSCLTHNIEAALMGEAVNRLEEFSVVNTLVTRDQVNAIIDKIVMGESKLKKLMLGDMKPGEFDVDSATKKLVEK